MIRVAFWFNSPIEYTGGYNYLNNLLFASSRIEDKNVSFYIFFSTDVNESQIAPFRKYAEIIQTNILKRYSFLWFLNKILNKFFNSSILINYLLKKYNIDVLSHSWDLFYGKPYCKLVSWIPDFQYLHLPELFPNLDLVEQNEKNILMAKKSNLVILSSNNARDDFESFTRSSLKSKVKVLPFVSQPSKEVSRTSNPEVNNKTYKNFFFLPNQFWEHKNHIVVFEAFRILKEKGLEIKLVCTGNLNDMRTKNSNHINSLKKFILKHNLEPNINILGMVSYEEVLSLMKNSMAVINPSKFEGWSSTVEEAKSMGKKIILSSIPVHIEQSPANSLYFDKDDPSQLAKILIEVIENYDPEVEAGFQDSAKSLLEKRTISFGRNYLSIIEEVVG